MTAARSLRARVRWDARQEKYVWSLRNPAGQTLAAGEEFKLVHAFQNAHDVTFAVQIWAMFGRGKIYSPTGRLDIEFVPVQHKIPGW